MTTLRDRLAQRFYAEMNHGTPESMAAAERLADIAVSEICGRATGNAEPAAHGQSCPGITSKKDSPQ